MGTMMGMDIFEGFCSVKSTLKKRLQFQKWKNFLIVQVDRLSSKSNHLIHFHEYEGNQTLGIL